MSGLTPLREHKSPHFDPTPIPVEFLILHYTAQSLQGTLNIFLSDTPPVSCHLIIDREGRVFEMVPCWGGVCHRAFHAGKSRWTDPENPTNTWKSFNNFSIGVELVNWNGNFYPYTEAQYQSLFQVIHHLKRVYPKLTNPNHILGHEQIAGFRGKVDPGIQFDWRRFFREVYGTPSPKRMPQLSEKQTKNLIPLLKNNPNDEKAKKWNLILESPIPFWLKKLRLKYDF